eukprot:CAMPEP_0176115734 /NCGR_PEP_ID=MMETSP0120_2-20121206/58120_1 /TAXON_ID=160619 /ORGANISM="Kryptoperidinium foliaceum, Strain CCMP 1326" /LENGTH=334 /DNA_ID=CAMNT_0017449973 /DNA_START=19 /DNA_END=1023 /DNA_ORIENTATION=-
MAKSAALATPTVPVPDQGELKKSVQAFLRQMTPGAIGLAGFAVLTGVAGLAGCAAVFVGAARPFGKGAAIVGAPPLSVRALLASDEFAEATRKNLAIMSTGGAADMAADELRAHISRGVARIDAALEQLHPEAHRQLSSIELTTGEKEAGLRVIRMLGDERMLAVSRSAVEAIEESRREGAESGGTIRRLSEGIAPRVRDLVLLHREMFPHRPVVFQADPSAKAKTWRPPPDVGANAPGHRISPLDELSGGVNIHVQALFEVLEGELGDRMPTAPAHMLRSSCGDPSSESDTHVAKLMNCLTSAVPNTARVGACIAPNIGTVYKLLMNSAKGVF